MTAESKKEIAAPVEKYISNDISFNKNLNEYPPDVITKMLLAAIFGIALQYILEPEDKSLLEGLNMIQAVIE